MRRKKQWVIVLICFIFFLVGCKKKSQTELSVYNWGDYIDTETIRMFEKETGIKVNYSTFGSNEDMYIKIKNSTDNYDVIVPSDYMIERLIREGLIQKIDKKNITNYNGLNPEILNAAFDPDNDYSIPYFWGTLGIVYNQKEIKEPIDQWKDLWNPKYEGKIIMYNSLRDTLAVGLLKNGYSVNTTKLNELEKAKDDLIKQKKLVYAYLADEGRDVVVQGDADITVMYSGDALMMIEENPNLKYVVPKEGTNIWYDSFCIPTKAKHKAEAEKFIDFMCRPEISAMNAEYSVGYTSPVLATKSLLPKSIQNSEIAYPDISKLPIVETYTDLPELRKIYDQIWTEIISTM